MDELDYINEMLDSDDSYYAFADWRDESGAIRPAVGCMVPIGCALTAWVPVVLIILAIFAIIA